MNLCELYPTERLNSRMQKLQTTVGTPAEACQTSLNSCVVNHVAFSWSVLCADRSEFVPVVECSLKMCHICKRAYCKMLCVFEVHSSVAPPVEYLLIRLLGKDTRTKVEHDSLHVSLPPKPVRPCPVRQFPVLQYPVLQFQRRHIRPIHSIPVICCFLIFQTR